jgi:7-cyano-7-deazaguanine synthase
VTQPICIPDSVAIASGGLDSTVLVYDMLSQGYTPHMISFNYGQLHKVELIYAAGTAKKLGLPHDIIDLSGLTHLISNSALTSAVARHTKPSGKEAEWTSTPHIEVPEGHYAEDNMKLTVVPNRNMIMLSIAAGIAVNNSYRVVATGVHSGDHFVYPDCRPEFIHSCNTTIVRGNAGFGVIPEGEEGGPYTTPFYQFIYAPFIDRSKADIAYRALQLGIPFEETWSCYKGEGTHCGKCGTCVERLEAIGEARQRYFEKDAEGNASLVPIDKTKYLDTEFWRIVSA